MSNMLIIDGFNLAFKAHFAFMKLSTSGGPTGTPKLSGCIYGFLVTLRSIKKRFPDRHITIAWDSGSVHRKALFADYKANRPAFRLDDPIKDLKKALSCVNVTQAETPGEEADDVIATLAERAEGSVYIYSSDKDLLQLVKDGKVVMIRPKSGIHPEIIFDEERVKEEFGVGPQDLTCYQAFKGDSVDNIPGVPRMPTKIIASLSLKYNTPKAIYASIENEKLTDLLRLNLLKSEQQVILNYDLVTLRKDLNVIQTLGKADPERFDEILKSYEIKALSSDNFLKVFENESAFLMRTTPVVESISLF